MAEPWIKMRLHRDHQRVIQVAKMTGKSADFCLACMVDWCRYCDFELPHGGVPLTREIVHRKAGWVPIRAAQRKQGFKDLVDAFLDVGVGWLESDDDGNLFVTDFEKHLGAGAKRRAQEADRKAAERISSASEADKGRTKNRTKSATDGDGEVDRDGERIRIDLNTDQSGSEFVSEMEHLAARGKVNPLSCFDPKKANVLWRSVADVLQIRRIARERPGTPGFKRARQDQTDLVNNILPPILERGDDAIRRSIEIAVKVRNSSGVKTPLALFKTLLRQEGIMPRKDSRNGKKE